jgi:RNA-splicing ligase RtcB
VLSQLSQQGIAVRIATKKLAAEEAPESHKDVSQVRWVLRTEQLNCHAMPVRQPAAINWRGRKPLAQCASH